MRPIYKVSPLAPEELRLAFPVVRMLDPSLTLDRWIAYADDCLALCEAGAKCAVLTARSEQGTIHGLALCRLRPDLRHGRELEVENFVGLDFRGGKQVTAALLHGIETLAGQWGCRHIRLSRYEAPQPTPRRPRARGSAAVFRRAGYREEPLFLGKTISARLLHQGS